MNQLTQISDLWPMLPEIVMACGAMVMLMVGVGIYQSERSARIVNGFCVAVLALTGLIIAMQPSGRTVMFYGSFMVDEYARFLKLLAIFGSGGALMLSLNWLSAEKQQRFEYGVLFLLSTLGMMMLISAVDLIAGGAIHASPSRFKRSMSARSCASSSSFLTRRSPQLSAFGFAKCTLAPKS